MSPHRSHPDVEQSLTPAAAINGVLTSGQIRMPVRDLDVFVANQGETVIAHGVDQGLQNILINTANNVDLRTDVDLSLDVSGYANFRDQIMGMRAGEIVGAAAVDAAFNAI